MVLEEKVATADELQKQVDRIVHSEEFRGSEVLRRLLTFLMARAVAGEADNLKEYVVAIDGLGKSPTTTHSIIPPFGFKWGGFVSGLANTTGQRARMTQSLSICPKVVFA